MQRLAAFSTQLGKWCAIALVLVTPGSFVVLPVIWLARNWQRVKDLGAVREWRGVSG